MSKQRLLANLVLATTVIVVGVLVSSWMIRTKPLVESTRVDTPPPFVRVVPVEIGPHTSSVLTHGTVEPGTQTRLLAEVVARVLEVSKGLENGGFVAEDEVLVRLDATDYELALEEARLGLAQAELRLAREQADAAIAKDDWEQSHPDRTPDPLVLREPQLAEARAALSAARARIQKAGRDIDRCLVRAPYEGRVRSQNVARGDFVQPGQELARLYAIDRFEVRLPIPDAELAHLEIPFAYEGEIEDGPTVTLEARFAGEQRSWQGRIIRTEGELDKKSRMVILVATVEDPFAMRTDVPRAPLSLGMFVEATIRGKTLDEAILLPRTALRSGGRVFVEKDGRLGIRAIEVHQSLRDTVVLTRGLAEGERVVVSTVESAVEGMRVRTTEVPR